MKAPKIVPHIWFDTQAALATALYATLFPNSRVDTVRQITDTPSGDCDVVSFTLWGQEFQAISAGPYFKLNPAISLFVTFDTEAQMDTVWNALVDGGQVLMPYDTYPWASKYGWLQDRYGVSWQMSLGSEANQTNVQRITPMLMYTQGMAGQAAEAIAEYTSVFPESTTDLVVPYAAGDGDTEGFIKHARFTLGGYTLMAMDSSGPHQFVFNEAVSLVVLCDTQEEVDYYTAKLSAVPEAEQCGWIKDKYGVSWQIVPSAIGEMMASGDDAAVARLTQAWLPMKKFDIAALKKAFAGE
jgi:predicted 3-demethylubiquinone-9 3-methyltransferase (glyoxalase superfamily)